MSARSAKEMSKYMVDIRNYHHLSNLIEYLNKDWNLLPEWEKDFVSDIKVSVQCRIKDHFESTAATRQKFVSMPKDIWKEEDTGLFRLQEQPRPVLGYLPAKELRVLDELCKAPMVGEIQDNRKTLPHLFESMRASQADIDEVSELVNRDSFFLKDVEDHRNAVDLWTTLNQKKVPIIQQLEAREAFLDEVEEFEKRTSGDKTRYSRNSIRLAEEAKFRANAARRLVQQDEEAVSMCQEFKTETGRDFEIDGIKYLEMIQEQRVGRSSHLSLSLAKLRPNAIPSSTIYHKDAGEGEKKPSLHERGASTNGLIRRGRDSLTPSDS